jgi:hypothetical protein
VALSDGNPTSTTALLANSTFSGFGSLAGNWPDPQGNRANSVSITFDDGQFSAEGFHGSVYSLPISGHFRVTNRVAIDFQIPLQYIDILFIDHWRIGIARKVRFATQNDRFPIPVTH